LPTGQTYRVTGQPHPNGAIAFLFDDISAEISLTRRFRSELELGQAVVDTVDEAIAVFSHDGAMVLCNRPYQEMWSCDDSAALTEVMIEDAVGDWMTRCGDKAFWARVMAFIARSSPRDPWQAEPAGRQNERFTCRLVPLAGGATLIGFRAENFQAREDNLTT